MSASLGRCSSNSDHPRSWHESNDQICGVNLSLANCLKNPSTQKRISALVFSVTRKDTRKIYQPINQWNSKPGCFKCP